MAKHLHSPKDSGTPEPAQRLDRQPLSEALRSYLARVGAPSDREVAQKLEKRLQLVQVDGRRVTLSPGLINQWKHGNKAPSRFQLVEMARFICELSESSLGAQSKPLSLDEVLYHLLLAGGRSFNTPDFVGDRLSESQMDSRRSIGPGDSYVGVTDTEAANVPKVRLAAVNAPPFMELGGRGLCGEIASYVVKLMGAEPEWVTTDWENLRKMLEAKEVDLIPPVLFTAPTRLRDFAFSEAIGLIAGFKAVVPKNGYSACVDALGLNPAKVEVVSIAGEIGQLFCRIAGAARSHEEAATHADAGRRLLELSRRWTAGRAVPVLVSEISTCDGIIADHETHLQGAELRIEHQMRFPFAFGMRYGEPTLMQWVNVAIRDIKRTGVLAAFFRNYSDRLGSTVWIDSDVPKRLMPLSEFSDSVPATKHQSKEPKS
jgi:ABC-type amino acid transport substrate-binding protein